MSVQIYAETDPGQERTQNEDSIAFDAVHGVCVLADGMGGHNAGEIASGMAAAFIKSELREWMQNSSAGATVEAVRLAVQHAIDQANSAIHNMSKTNPRYSGMGTTLVVGVFYEEKLVLAHVGDSRCYRLRDGALEQLTKDHSVHQEQIDAGLWREGQEPAREQNLVTRALGVDEYAQADFDLHDAVAGDVYLMCSDGLSDMISIEAIAGVLRAPDTISARVKRLVDAANAAGGKDNIAVLLAQVGDPEEEGLLGAARKMLRSVWSG